MREGEKVNKQDEGYSHPPELQESKTIRVWFQRLPKNTKIYLPVKMYDKILYYPF